jgi:hypothetical protein
MHASLNAMAFATALAFAFASAFAEQRDQIMV